METHRIGTAIAVLLAASSAQADIVMTLSADKSWQQVDAVRLNFLGGELGLFLRDGIIIIDGACVTQPQPNPFPPTDIPPCPLGSTAFIAAGDVDRDGNRDDNQYWSVLSVIPALVVEPFRPELCGLYSAPPSKLVRPLENFRDDGVITFYNTNQTDMRQYNQSRYELIKTYGSVRQQERIACSGFILIGGELLVQVSGVGIAPEGLAINIPVLVAGTDTPEEWAFKVVQAMRQVDEIANLYTITIGGFLNNEITFTETVADGNDDTLNISILPGTAVNNALPILESQNLREGVLIPGSASLQSMNEEIVVGSYTFTFPRLSFPELTPVAIPINITPHVEALGSNARAKKTGFRYTSGTWSGGFMQLDPRTITAITWTGNDRTVIRPGDQFYFSIESRGGIAFPPTGNPVILSNPTITQYNLPPFFFDVGDTGTINLNYQRLLGSSGVAFDTSERNFRAAVRFVDSYKGFAQITYPLGTSRRDLSPDGDVDEDGIPNGDEFAFEWPTAELIDSLDPIIAEDDAEALGFGFPAAIEDSQTRPAVTADPVGSFPMIQAPVTELDIDNHIVVKASKRPLTGSTLKYTFQILDNSGKKPKFKQIKAGSQWTITTVTEMETLTIGGIEMELPHDYVILRSTSPVANPADPLPEISIKFTFQNL